MSRLLRIAALALVACGPTHDGTPTDLDGGDDVFTGDTAAPDGTSGDTRVAPDNVDASDAHDTTRDLDVGDDVDAGDALPDTSAGDTSPVEDTALPDRVLFRTATESFNQRYFVALREGRIWVKPNTDARPEASGAWHLLGASGLPEGSNLVNFGPPATIVALSADGIHLHALSGAGVFYRGDDLTNAFLVEGTFNWTDRWGWPAAQGPGLHAEWSTARGWSVSDSHPLGVARYQDRDGTTHSVGMGVAHLYRLGPDGRRIYFNDWWLPADWSRQICGPERGTFTAVNLSVSASTLFVVDASGAMFTRLYDFDTGGENTLLTYSYVIDGPSGTTRKLPAEDWRRQPDVDGRVTRRITIFQDGQGNAARVLRVEGERDGVTGYFEKRVFDDTWTFVATHAPLSGPLLDAEGAPAPAPDDHAYAGTLRRGDASLVVEVPDFNPFCSPSHARLVVDGQRVTRAGAPLELPLHHVHLMVTKVRPTDYWEAGEPASIRAALLVPGGLLGAIDDASARARVEALLGDARVINLTGTATRAHIALDEIPWTEPFLVPADEKALGMAFSLALDPN